jgi:hypothetical protein
MEDRERPSINIFKQVEKKKLLSTVEKAGLLRWGRWLPNFLPLGTPSRCTNHIRASTSIGPAN